MAHELAHRFLQTGHTESGILKGNFSRADLIGDHDELAFTANQAAQLAEVVQSVKVDENDTSRRLRSQDSRSQNIGSTTGKS